MYVHYLYLSCNVKKPNTNCVKRAETIDNSRSIHFLMVSSVKSALILLPFLIVAQHESGTRRIIPICNKYGVSSNIVEGEHKFVSSII